ncbi:unnamed protein product [Blepharisma stoltei]|uniref:Uncharacterized protein n=1 Tax=Blepharisma stoltei TaxID=1481888 RepID=A0AAU9I6H3_9CILI|nr:unnamed protein product [Blepharisma stoltei]
MMDNSSFNVKLEDISGMRLSKKAILTSKWALSMEVIEELIKDLSQYKEVGTKDFVTMRDEINNALKGYNDAKINLKNWIALQDKITGISIERKLLDATAEINKNYTIKSKVWQTETVETSYHNTLCSRCNTLCHERCGLQYTINTNANIFTGCACMDDVKCNVCSCDYTVHFHDKKKPVRVEKEITSVLAGMKEKYEVSTKNYEIKSKEESKCILESEDCNNKVKSAQQKITESVKRLLVVNPDYNILNEIEYDIKKNQHELDNEKDMKIRTEKNSIIKALTEIAHSISSLFK